MFDKPFDNRTIDDINKAYSGKSMAEITDLENARQDIIRAEIDEKHDEIAGDRTRMLTVGKLIDYLKTQDPDACILAYEENSFAYIEQWPALPNTSICTVKEHKHRTEENLKNWYKDTENAVKKIAYDMEKTYRYAKDNDVIIEF